MKTKIVTVFTVVIAQLATRITLPKTSIALEKCWLGDYFLFGMAYFQGRAVRFRESIYGFTVSILGRTALRFLKGFSPHLQVSRRKK